MRFPQMIHRLGGGKRACLVDVNEGPHALARGIGNPGEAFLDQPARGGASGIEIGSEAGKCRVRGHDRRRSLCYLPSCYLPSGAGTMSRSSSAELKDLPWASSASERV